MPMKKILFLDFDGVMDTKYYDLILNEHGLPIKDEFGVVFDPVCVENLKHIIEKTGVEIVVTSTWKYFMKYEDFLEMWKERELPGFITGVTPNLDYTKIRGNEIEAWLSTCTESCNYVIIDDLDGQNFLEHQIPRLIVVNPYTGLDEDSAERAIRLLMS